MGVRTREGDGGFGDAGLFTDARPDTGGLSGATPSEAVSWGKVETDHLPDAVVCYLDSTVALPLLTAYALDTHSPRPLKRLYTKREALVEALRKAAEERASSDDHLWPMK